MEENHSNNNKKQQHIVLVHGACHGAWCWYKVATMLTSAGHRVTVPDLAASGIDAKRLEELSTFSEYSKPLLKIMEGLTSGERVILVGHSFGGISIAMAMDEFPEKIEAAIFVAALLPDCVHNPCYPMKQLFHQHPSLADGFMDTQFSIIETPSKGHLTSLSPGPQFLANIYKRCPPEDLMLASTLVRPASLFQEDLENSPAFSKDRYGSVSSFYILCRDDEQIPEDYQRWMTENYPVKEVTEIDKASHMVMLTKPDELCKSILRIVHAMPCIVQ